MGEYAIKVEGLGKRYRIGRRQRYKALRDVLTDAVSTPFRQAKSLLGGWDGTGSNDKPTFWALKDVSFEVKHGEVVGIIGRNGAGKSTLLKILSRITEPTEGEVRLRGRVGSLLEVGTGFHPELTGRENVYLNGAILGMRRHEIERKFDEIVAFAEIARFLDTPVKHYSSGMYVRLAFSVAAHLEPEILLVDEVLAVGDAAFQRKCLGKMGEVAQGGRTVLFVSHNMGAIQRLCEKAILLSEGALVMMDRSPIVVEAYLSESMQFESAQTSLRDHLRRMPGAIAIATDLWIRNIGIEKAGVDSRRPVEILLRCEPPRALERPSIGLTVEDAHGHRICTFASHFSGIVLPPIRGESIVRCLIPDLPLLPGTYFLNVGIGDGQEELVDAVYQAASFAVHPHGEPEELRMSATRHGAVRIPAEWGVVES